MQPDLGTAVLLGLSALLIMFVAGTRLVYIIGGTMIAAPLVTQPSVPMTMPKQ